MYPASRACPSRSLSFLFFFFFCKGAGIFFFFPPPPPPPFFSSSSSSSFSLFLLFAVDKFRSAIAALKSYVMMHAAHTDLPSDVATTVHSAQQSILDAFELLQKMKTESQARDAGRQLEVNQALIDVAIQLMTHMKSTIDAAIKMQSELKVAHDHGLTGAEYKLLQRKWFACLLELD